jgi:quinol monooxygenase YgiN
MIVLTAIATAAEGKADTIIAEIKKLQPKVVKDPGCLGYTAHQAVDNPNKIMFYELYESQDALKYHGQTEHFKAFGLATKGMWAARTEMTFWNKLT